MLKTQAMKEHKSDCHCNLIQCLLFQAHTFLYLYNTAIRQTE